MRANIEILFQKSICILHRRDLTVRLPSVQTIDICADASMRMLELQVDLQQEAQPGGQLHEERWMLSSLTTTDFLLAAMILSLVLLQERARRLDQDPGRKIQQKLELLDKSLLIFDNQKFVSSQACKISLGLRSVKNKLNVVYGYSSSSDNSSDQSESVQVPLFMAVPQLNQDASNIGWQPANIFDDTVDMNDYFDWVSMRSPTKFLSTIKNTIAHYLTVIRISSTNILSTLMYRISPNSTRLPTTTPLIGFP